MSKSIYQFKGPFDTDLNIFENISVYKLGIQAPPGTKFKLNNGNNNISVGHTGIYELDLMQFGGVITSLIFTEIEEENNDQIIVDVIYTGAISYHGGVE